MNIQKYIVPAEFHKKRLDAFLAEECDVTRSQVKKWVEKGYVSIAENKIKNAGSGLQPEPHVFGSEKNEQESPFSQNIETCGSIYKIDPTLDQVPNFASKAGEKLSKGDEILLSLPEESTPEVSEIALENILYEDENCIVVNKPAEIVTHPDATHIHDSLLQRILAHCELSSIGLPDRPGVVHRLDKDTSGVIVFAKNDEAHIYISNLFASRETKKHYLALVHGKGLPQEGTIDSPITRDTRNRKKMTVSASDKAKYAVSHFEILEQFADSTLVKVNIETGRTHQIRVHLSSIGHPIVGDPVYGNPKLDALFEKKYTEIPRLLLHAYSLAFVPFSQKSEKEFVAALAGDFEGVLKRILN